MEQETENKIKEWESRNYPNKIVDKRIYYTLIVTIFIFSLAGLISGLYLGVNNKFKSEVNTTTICLFNSTTICEKTECPKCPSQVCDCSDVSCNFPDNITLLIKNGS